jgi:hypothetical protein
MRADPDTCVQLELDLFPNPSFEDLLAQRNIDTITVVRSRRLRRGWHATINAATQTRVLLVPAFFEDAPAEIKTALVEWTLLLSRPKNAAYRRRKRNLERLIFSFVESSGRQVRNRSLVDPSAYETRGRIYDLAEVFDTLNKRYFGGDLSSFVRWGRHPFRSFQSCRRDGAGTPYNLITVASMYNRPDAPRCAVEGIMHHEMLHIALPPRSLQGRNVIHGREFRQRERRFPGYRRWIAWEKDVCSGRTRKG